MCPNCERGLTEKREVCIQCGGTGFWNTASLSTEEVREVEVKVAEEQKVAIEIAQAELLAKKANMSDEQAANAEGVAEGSTVEVETAEVGAAVETSPEEKGDGGVQAPAEEAVKEEVVA